MKKLEPISISLNFDSINESLGFPKKFKDPSYFKGFDRVIDVINKYNIKISIFVIGKDLKNKEIFSRVRDWSSAGHEIGNHSWSHFHNLGSLNIIKTNEEIFKTHEIIYKCTKKEPKGFISPSWNISKKIITKLIDLNYTYDHSIFPSFGLFLTYIKDAFNHIGSKRFFRIINRKDWLHHFLLSKKPFFVDKSLKKNIQNKDKKILIMPLPTRSRFHIPLWYTVGFVFGWKFFFKSLKKFLNNNEYFYLLFHPADFTSNQDISFEHKNYLQRFNVPIDEKMKILKKVFKIISESKRKCIKMDELANYYKKNMPSLNLPNTQQ